MLIDCHTCVARDIACNDCVISVLLATPPPRRVVPPADSGGASAHCGDADDFVELDDTARYALENLADAGLVPPLRLVAALPERDIRLSRNGREIA